MTLWPASARFAENCWTYFLRIAQKNVKCGRCKQITQQKSAWIDTPTEHDAQPEKQKKGSEIRCESNHLELSENWHKREREHTNRDQQKGELKKHICDSRFVTLLCD
jgi:phage FluMu protein Com